MKDNFDMPDEPVAFDMSVSTLVRINYWLWRANHAQFEEDPITWFKTLKIIYKEISPFLNKKNKKEEKTEMEVQEEKLDKVEENYKKYIKEITNKQKNKLSRDIFDSLFSWDIELRKKADEKGLLMRKGEDAATTMFRS